MLRVSRSTYPVNIPGKARIQSTYGGSKLSRNKSLSLNNLVEQPPILDNILFYFDAALSCYYGDGDDEVCNRDGQLVKTWRDLSTGLDSVDSLSNLTQPTVSKRPVWNSQGANGRPSLSFDGVDDFMATTTNTTYEQKRTLYLVLKTLLPISAGHGVTNGRGTVDTGEVQIRQDTLAGMVNYTYFTGLFINTGTTSPTPLSLLSTAVIGELASLTIVSDSPNGRLGVNNKDEVIGDPGSSAIASGLAIGGSGNNSLTGQFFTKVEIAEFLQYSALHDIAQRSLMKDYLMRKYNLQ